MTRAEDQPDFGAPDSGSEATPQQFSSRRELRASLNKAASSRRLRDAPARRDSKVVDKPSRKVSARAARRAAVTAKSFDRAPKRERKNPLSVFVTMLAVGGMFAVAGLPAYAINDDPEQVASTKDASAEVFELQSLRVADAAVATAPVRDGYSATTAEDLAAMARDALRAAQNEAYNNSGARALGDDYPWPYELMNHQGGGLSPLNYYYRECVDFVAWRLNRDVGSYSAPFKYTWSDLTPTGGDGSQWKYAWKQHGWPISDVPIAGAVAYTGGNHIAYVKQVLDGGYVLIEEYNYAGPGLYGQRVIPTASVNAFLYPPG